MKIDAVLAELRLLKVETGSFACLGCGHEYHCSVSGCAILNEAAETIEFLRAENQRIRQTYLSPEVVAKILEERDLWKSRAATALITPCCCDLCRHSTGGDPECIDDCIQADGPRRFEWDDAIDTGSRNDYWRDLLEAEKDGRLRIVKRAPEGKHCGECADFIREAGTARGTCKTQLRKRFIRGKQEPRQVCQSTKACAEFKDARQAERR